MKTSSTARGHRLIRASLLVFLFASVAVPLAHAGLTFNLHLIRDTQGTDYNFYADISTNDTPPDAPLGNYLFASPQQPASGTWRQLELTTNGFNFVDGGSSVYGDFASAMQQITNGNWTVTFTNATTTNHFIFTVSAPNLTSNMLPALIVTTPTENEVFTTTQPTFTWEWANDWGVNSDAFVFNDDFSYFQYASLPATQNNWAVPALPPGENLHFQTRYTTNSLTAFFTATTPFDTNSAQPISGWVSTATLESDADVGFSVNLPSSPGGLVAHYDFDENTALAADVSGNGNDLVFAGDFGGSGPVTDTDYIGSSGGSVRFDGGSYLSAPASLLPTLAGSFTISFWVKTTQDNGDPDDFAWTGDAIISADIPSSANDLIPAALTGGQVAFNTANTDFNYDDTINSSMTVNNGDWHHVVVSRNQPTGEKFIYIDGVLDASDTDSTNLLNDPQLLTIGCKADASESDSSSPSNTGGNGYDGLVDDIQIYNRVLSPSEVVFLYDNPGSTAANGGGSSGGHTNVAHYTFDTTNKNTYDLGLDSSPNDNNMVTYGYWGMVHTNSIDAVAGGGAAEFFGTSGMVCYDPVLANLNAVLAGSFSFSTWVKTTASRGNDSDNAYFGATIFWAYNDNGNTNDTIPLAITGGKAAFTTRGGNSGASDTLHSLTSVNDGNYHLITVTRDQASGEKKMYVDGNFEASEVGTTAPLNGNDYYLSIGGTVYSSYTGLLDDLQIYSGVLDATEVSYLYNHPGSTVADIAGGGTLADAVDTTNLIWTTGGDAGWFTQSSETHDGSDAARSGAITDSQESWIQTAVTGPGTLSFWWKVASEQDYDFLEFDLDGNWQEDMSGDTDWQQRTYSITTGSHTLKWRYYKDDSNSDPVDAGFLDQVVFVPDQINTNSAPVIIVNPINQTNSPGYTVGLYAAATSNPTATWQWFKVGIGLITNATSALYIPTNSGTVGVAGGYYAVASNSLGTATTRTASVSFVSAPLPPDWSRVFKSPLANDTADETTNYNIACLIDSTGTNIYTVGSFVGTNTFGSDSLISINGQSGSSILKQTVTGTPIWGRCMTNNGNGSSYAQSVAAAPGGGIYVAGVVFGTNWLGTNQLVDIAGGSTYVARFDANGNNLWVRLITGTNFNFSTYHMLASDPDGNVTVSSLIWGYTSFGSTNLFADGQRGVLVQYDANGNVRWLQMPSGWPESLVYNAGRLYGSMGGDSTGYIGGVTNVSDRRHMLFSLNATNGQAYWVQGVASQTDQGPPVFGNDDVLVAVSRTNIFITGNGYGSNAVFGPFTVNFPVNEGQYLARYDTDGNAQLATAFGSAYTWPWAIGADAAGDVYIGGDFDTYSVFGSNVISAPFYETIQSVGGVENRIPGQSFMAKFDRNGNSLWARTAQSQSSYLNLRDLAVASDGVWACGFFNQPSAFDTITIYGETTIVGGSPFGYLVYHPSGYLAKIIDSTAVLNPVLLNAVDNGVNFQFQFLTQSGVMHAVQYRTNLILGNWLNYSNVTGDGNLKTIPIPLSVFAPSLQGFVRVTNAVAP